MNVYLNSWHERVWIYFISGAVITLAVGIVVGSKNYFFNIPLRSKNREDLRNSLVLLGFTPV